MFLIRKTIRNSIKSCSKLKTNPVRLCSNNSEVETTNNISSLESEYNSLADICLGLKSIHKCLIIQPYVKWGPQKLPITPQEQLEEATALIQTLPGWQVLEKSCIPLDNLDRKTLFKSGSLDRIKALVESSTISAIFVNVIHLKKVTITILQEYFRKPVLDRYNIVMQILKNHATSKYAKLQVALAEMYYIKRKSELGLLSRSYNKETLKLIFQEKEQKLKKEIDELRSQRSLLRKNRKKMDYPVVAVVGYTNAGKTSIIKTLTDDENLTPKDQLFATLDVTVHQDIPTNLIECFVATLEDALLADVILHVQDLSSTCYEYKRDHVIQTLQDLEKQSGVIQVMEKVVDVGNKCDLFTGAKKPDILPVSAKFNVGLDELKNVLQENILKFTQRQNIVVRIPNGGQEMTWLYKNGVVLNESADPNDQQFTSLDVILTQSNLQKFKHYFK
ncbi:putative GTP-binding protein 6 isoform X2 [Cylas formicarius]|uniref:putative GTP-binding protein 6 isoform X2 n=1 Tax=Cylas formicarius TaxID=197179 RepID=UPI002958C041|nr:putative GTP-binding protein 6 isoform X2 [Cylas formicarius]